jgi:hypothetical protein
LAFCIQKGRERAITNAAGYRGDKAFLLCQVRCRNALSRAPETKLNPQLTQQKNDKVCRLIALLSPAEIFPRSSFFFLHVTAKLLAIKQAALLFPTFVKTNLRFTGAH